eukprot:COSAG06_NODE_6374_length_2959_cov_3.355134_3_plen_122_part_00
MAAGNTLKVKGTDTTKRTYIIDIEEDARTVWPQVVEQSSVATVGGDLQTDNSFLLLPLLLPILLLPAVRRRLGRIRQAARPRKVRLPPTVGGGEVPQHLQKKKTPFSLEFSGVCPEPVLAK